jgi:hypothetical protein
MLFINFADCTLFGLSI